MATEALSLRVQAKRAACNPCARYGESESCQRISGAEAASDVWEPILKELIETCDRYLNGEVDDAYLRLGVNMVRILMERT